MAKKSITPKTSHRRVLKTLAHAIEFLFELEQKQMALDQRIVDAQAALDGKIKDLDAKVDAFVASHTANTETDVQAIVDKTTAEGAAVDAVAAKLPA